jgi:5-formyltetrahydrofolate cyclo-ligase
MTEMLTSKEDARRRVMTDLREGRACRFPFVPSRRIPNFKGANEAALGLFEFSEIDCARVVKCNPDSPQRLFREEALRRGKTLLVPTPRLVDDFLVLDPADIPPECFDKASRSSGFSTFGRYCELDKVPQPDVTIVGSVAVSPGGGRCGKGHGYADLESAMLRAVGLRSTPVFTTVHSLQLAYDFSIDPTDLVLTGVATPEGIIRFRKDFAEWPVLDWEVLSEKQIREIPLLSQLYSTRTVRP